MAEVSLRFYGQLNFFLHRSRQQVAFTHRFDDNPSIKDMIESIGVPHTEVRSILINGSPVDFNYHVQDGDQISVYPVENGIEGAPELHPPLPDGVVRFVLDVHLGRLAAYLRLLGFDTLYQNDYDDPELARLSNTESRILLTRDVGLLKRNLVQHGYYIRNTKPEKQVAEVVRQFDLIPLIRNEDGDLNEFAARCLRCNSLLEVVDRSAVASRLPDSTVSHYDEFRLCPSCNKIYWRGSHYQKMRQLIERALTKNA